MDPGEEAQRKPLIVPAEDARDLGVDARPSRQRPPRGWEGRITHAVGSAIRYWRERRQMTTRELEEATSQLGQTISRAVITNLENQRRDAVSLAEVLVLAAALDVSPILLIAPVGREPKVEILPGVEVTPWESRGWVHGALAAKYANFSNERWTESNRVLYLYEVHRNLIRRYHQMVAALRVELESDELSIDSAGRRVEDAVKMQRERQRAYLQAMVQSLAKLREHRELISAEGFLVPELPPDVTIDQFVLQGGILRAVGSVVAEDSEAIPPLFNELRRQLDRRLGHDDASPD